MRFAIALLAASAVLFLIGAELAATFVAMAATGLALTVMVREDLNRLDD